MPPKRPKRGALTKEEKETQQLGSARTVSSVIKRGMARLAFARQLRTLDGLLATGERKLYVAMKIRGETPRGAFGKHRAPDEIQMFNTHMHAPFKKALMMVLQACTPAYRQRILARDITILRLEQYVPLKTQKKRNPFTASTFVVNISINCEKGGCKDKVLEDLLKALTFAVDPDSGINGVSFKLRKLGVETLLSAGLPAECNPVVSIPGKIKLRQPVPAYLILKKLDPVSLARMETVSKPWKKHISFSADILWRRACQSKFVSPSGKLLRMQNATNEEDPITDGYKRGTNYPWREAYAALHMYMAMCQGRGKYKLLWALDREGQLKPQWNEIQWRIMQNAIKICQTLCPAFSPPRITPTVSADEAPRMPVGEVEESEEEDEETESDEGTSEESEDDSSEDDGLEFQGSIEATTAYFTNLFNSPPLPELPVKPKNTTVSRPSTKQSVRWEPPGSRCTTPYLSTRTKFPDKL